MDKKMNHKEKYKHKADTVDKLRDKRRNQEAEIRKNKREELVNSKRVRLEETDFEYEEEVTHDMMLEAATCLVKKTGNQHQVLITIRRGFAQGSALIDLYLSVDTCLSSLVGVFSGNDLKLQLEASWCLTNMSASIHQHAYLVVKVAGPYLVTYLSSGNVPLQDQCAWALGNLAGDGEECREILYGQGVIPPLVDLLRSPASHVVQSAAFALSNLARGGIKYTSDMLDRGCLPYILSQLTVRNAQSELENMNIVAEFCWILTYLAARKEHHELLEKEDTIKKLCDLVSHLSDNNPDCYRLLTPLLRGLGNLSSESPTLSAHVSEKLEMLPMLTHLLDNTHRHVKKEALWVISNISYRQVYLTDFESIFLGSKEICTALLNLKCVPKIARQLLGAHDLRKEAAFCMCNICSQGPDFSRAMLEEGVITYMAPLLKSPDVESAHLALAFSEMLLRDGGEKAQHQFEECGGLSGLEFLEYHDNDDLRGLANQILENYFYKEEKQMVS